MHQRHLMQSLGSAPPFLLAACANLSTASNGALSAERPWRGRLIEPVTQPTIFESPVIDSQVRPMLLHHELPSDSIFAGGSIDVIAA